MANDTIIQIDHSAPIKPVGTHPQNVRARRRKKEKKKKDGRQTFKQKDRLTIKGPSETDEDKKDKTPATDNTPARKNRIDIRI